MLLITNDQTDDMKIKSFGCGMLSLIVKKFVRLRMWQFKKKLFVPTCRAIILGDGISTRIITDGIYSGNELDVLKSEVFPNLPHRKMALDIGANIGNHATVFAQVFDEVKAYEINPRVFHILQSNSINTVIEPINYGLSDEEKSVFFEENFENMGASCIVDVPSESSFELKVRRLDSVLSVKEMSRVSFVKMDVEHHELNVLRGGKEFFKKHQPVIGFEGHFTTFPQMGTDIQDILTSFGYREFLELEYKNRFIRFCDKKLPVAIFKVVRHIIPRAKRSELQLVRTNNLAGKDYALIIASAYPILAN